MANLKDIRRRIGSVKSTQKITNALKLVSAAKFARASHAIQAARPYGDALDRLVASVLAAGGPDLRSELLAERPEERSLIVLLGSDRGQCGALNNNLFKKATNFSLEKEAAGIKIDVLAGGRRSILYSRKFGRDVFEQTEKLLDRPQYAGAAELVNRILAPFLDGRYDRIYIAYNRYQSALVQFPTVQQLLPVPRATDNETMVSKNYIFEPALPDLIGPLLMKQVCATMFRTMLEGAASEHGARMTAMDSATKNAKEAIRKLTLQYNRARQAAITKELIEIVSGAEALN